MPETAGCVRAARQLSVLSNTKGRPFSLPSRMREREIWTVSLQLPHLSISYQIGVTLSISSCWTNISPQNMPVHPHESYMPGAW